MTEQTQEQPQAQPDQEQVTTEQQPGFVDLSDLPEDKAKQIKDRIDYLVREGKGTQRAFRTLAQHNEAMEKRLQELESGISKGKTDSTLEGLRKQHAEALSTANYEEATRVAEAIADLKAEEKLAAVKPKAEPKPAENFQLDPEDERLAVSWATEANADGSRKRPWTDPNHPKHQRLIKVSEAVLLDEEVVSHGPQAIMAEIDRLMGMPAKAAAPNVLPSSPGSRPGKQPQLSREEKDLCQRAGWDEEKYLKQKIALGKR